MKQQLYAVFDTCAGIYDSPHFANSDDIVRRQFADIASGADNAISKHPEHYSLWRLGGWDNTNGNIQDEANECLCTALEAISQSQVVDSKKMDMLKNGLDPSVVDDPNHYKLGLTD